MANELRMADLKLPDLGLRAARSAASRRTHPGAEEPVRPVALRAPQDEVTWAPGAAQYVCRIWTDWAPPAYSKAAEAKAGAAMRGRIQQTRALLTPMASKGATAHPRSPLTRVEAARLRQGMGLCRRPRQSLRRDEPAPWPQAPSIYLWPIWIVLLTKPKKYGMLYSFLHQISVVLSIYTCEYWPLFPLRYFLVERVVFGHRGTRNWRDQQRRVGLRLERAIGTRGIRDDDPSNGDDRLRRPADAERL